MASYGCSSGSVEVQLACMVRALGMKIQLLLLCHNVHVDSHGCCQKHRMLPGDDNSEELKQPPGVQAYMSPVVTQSGLVLTILANCIKYV